MQSEEILHVKSVKSGTRLALISTDIGLLHVSALSYPLKSYEEDLICSAVQDYGRGTMENRQDIMFLSQERAMLRA